MDTSLDAAWALPTATNVMRANQPQDFIHRSPLLG
jgi:hypothetical protein